MSAQSALLTEGAGIPGLLEDETRRLGIPVFAGELWTARQRQMHPIHYTVSYRASFKPELPDFFIRKYLMNEGKKEGVVLDPFGGRGTSVLQANLLGYTGYHNDLNPVAHFLSSSRKNIPRLQDLAGTLEALDLENGDVSISDKDEERLSPFFHPRTLREILKLRKILLSPDGRESPEIQYLGVTALSRLYGHSDGFFSVYTFPQISIMPGAQRRNNLKRGQSPSYKSIKPRIIKKIKKDLSVSIPETYHRASRKNLYTISDAREMSGIKSSSVDLIVTSPPFLDKVDYIGDNWMRTWFLDLEDHVDQIQLGIYSDPGDWVRFMADAIAEMGRVLKSGGRAVIEVGEVRVGRSTRNLEEDMLSRLPMKVKGGTLIAEEIYLNTQSFTKLANCWDVKNNEKGTNTNRCLVIRKVDGKRSAPLSLV